MTTLGDMKVRIAGELSRSNLTSEIADAITTAISEYQKERFRFSDVIPDAPPTFNTVAGRYIYTSADNPNIGTLLKIDYVLITIGTTNMFLRRIPPVDLKLYNQTNTMLGQPSWYSYEGNEMMFAAIPTQAYPIELGLFRLVAAPMSDGEAGNPWMTDGELLIRSRAKFEIATHKTRNPAMAQAMSPFPPAENGGVVGQAYAAWRSLKREANRVTSLGRIAPMRF